MLNVPPAGEQILAVDNKSTELPLIRSCLHCLSDRDINGIESILLLFEMYLHPNVLLDKKLSKSSVRQKDIYMCMSWNTKHQLNYI